MLYPKKEEADMEFDKKSENLLEEIEDFVNKLQLTTEEIILRQIYPKFFKHKLVQNFLKATVEEDNKQEVAEKRVEELFQNLKIDTKSINYVPIKKD